MPKAATPHTPGPPHAPLHHLSSIPEAVLTVPQPLKPTPPSPASPRGHSCSSGGPLRPSAPTVGPPRISIPSSPSSCPAGSHCPLDPISGPVQPSLSLWPLLSGLFGPHCPSGPTSGAVRISLSPLAPPQALSGPHGPLSPCWAAQQPIHCSPSPSGRCIHSAKPSGSLVVIPDFPFLPASARRAGHSLLLEQHHVAPQLGGCPLPARPPARFPAAALPVARPGPAACAPSSWSAPSPPLSLRSPRRLLPPRPCRLPRRCRRRPELRFRSAARGRGVSAATRASHAAVRADLSAKAEPSRARPLHP